MFTSLKSAISTRLAQAQFYAAFIVFGAQKFFDDNCGKDAVKVLAYKKPVLKVAVDRYLLQEYTRKTELINALEIKLNIKNLVIEWRVR